MFAFLRYYANLYGQFIATSASVDTNFRTNFFSTMIVSLVIQGNFIFTFDFIFDHVATIGPWNREQALFFISFLLAIESASTMIVAPNLWEFSKYIKHGELDFVLLKPSNSIFAVFFRIFRISSTISFLVALAMTIFFGLKVLDTFLDWLLLPFLFLLSLALLSIVQMIITIPIFWTKEGFGLNLLQIEFRRISFYPDFIYGPFFRHLFITLIPFLLIGSAPVHFLFDYQNYQLLLLMMVVLVFAIFVLAKLWKLGLRGYNSASS